MGIDSTLLPSQPSPWWEEGQKRGGSILSSPSGEGPGGGENLSDKERTGRGDFPHFAAGPPNAPAIVFLHGFLGRGTDWQLIIAGLANRFHCLAPDLPGHGAHSLTDYAKPINFKTLASHLLGWLERLGIRRFTLVGYSMGGRLALYTALHHPQNIAALVLESASAGIADPTQRAARAALDDRRAADIRQRGLAAFLDDWYAMPLFTSLRRYPTLLAQLKRERTAIPAEWAARVIAELSPGRQPALWNRLPELRLPTLLIWGDLDPRYPAIMQHMASCIPTAQIAPVPDAGHNVHAERPGEFLHALQTFLAA